MKIVLYAPCIPQNTGNIIRTCSVTGSELILVRPLGFQLSDRMLKRSGLDYHSKSKLTIIDDLEEYLDNTLEPFYFFSSKAKKYYSEVNYENDSILIFGSETDGLPDNFWEKYNERFVTIPMKNEARCLNLSNSVAIALYEGLRQQQFSFIDVDLSVH